MKFSDKDIIYMKRALRLAGRGRFGVSPNPMVGAVMVKNGKIVAEGWHKKFGEAHAEKFVLKNASKIEGATLYVTMEPCCHTDKKTPPCTREILKANISRVVIASKDPNPFVNGKGIKQLSSAGIHVESGCMEKEARILNEKYIKWITEKMPFVSLKFAMSMDGKIATKTGDSKWISSEKSRQYVHKLRDEHDAILVGIGTVLKDNPILSGTKNEPVRIILDSTLKIPAKAKILRDKNVIIVTTLRAPKAKIDLLKKHGFSLKIFSKKIPLRPLLGYLAKQNIGSILVEGGSEIYGSFIDEKLVDKFYIFMAPKIIGGKNAVSAVGGKGINKIRQAFRINNYSVRKIGSDILIMT